jgi:hypothetical protein
MKFSVLSLAIVFLNAVPGNAIKITLFTDTNTFVQRAQDIWIAKCLGPVPDGANYDDGLYPVDVEVVSVLKGAKKAADAQKRAKAQIATIYPMEAGKIYLLTSLGGSAFGTDFLAVPELSVVELPSNFRVDELNGKTLVEQVQAVFAARRLENERQQRWLVEEKKLLDKAVAK